MRLYRLLLPLLRALIQLYFAEVYVAASERCPRRTPVLVAANHPGSILDPILLATQVPRPVRYLAGSKLFRSRWLGVLLRQLGAIPVYRRSEGGDAANRNVEMFARVFDLLEAGGCVGIFPEGRNSPDGRLGPLRTGAARIALGAEDRQGFTLGLTIVPVGIALSARDFLLSTVVLRFAPPIRVGDYADAYRTDPEGAVAALTAEIEGALRDASGQARDRELGRLAGELAALFGHELTAAANEPTGGQHLERGRAKRWLWRALDWYRQRATGHPQPFDARVEAYRQIATVLSRALEHEPAEVADLRKRVERYKAHAGQTELRRTLDSGQLDSGVRQQLLRLRMTIYAVGAAPVALFGLVHNGPPYAVTHWLARGFGEEAVRAFAYFGIGALVFAATYLGIGLWLGQATPLAWGWIAAYLLALPPTGLAALHYRRKVLVYRDRILVRTLIWNHGELARLLQHERRAILQQFQALAARFGAQWPSA